ncbi:hypothetical protein ABZX38_02330 [Streptomyces longwoodensis]|uniref:hypothetical protein n=1 Tax=Streptomyces longwoodensis TaxID=68231 RepID=UPI0033B858DF
MPEATDSEAFEPDEAIDPAPLSTWSRATAGIIGFTLCGAGTVAVFKTENQAGCVALILAGALFVVLTIGGNPLHSLGFGETQMRFAVQRRRRQVIASVSDAPPEEARRTLEVLQAIDPGAANDASFLYQSARTYEALAKQRFLTLFPDCAIGSLAPRDWGYSDFQVLRPIDKRISVDALFLERAPSGISRTMISKRAEKAVDSILPTLIMSNVPLSHGAQQALEEAQAHGTKMQYVFWQDERHDQALQAAAEELFAQIP